MAAGPALMTAGVEAMMLMKMMVPMMAVLLLAMA
jgi:hypothetical protein